MRLKPKVSSSPTCHPSLLPIWACPHGQSWRSSQGASCYLLGVQEVWAGSIWLPAPFAPIQLITRPEGLAPVTSGTAAHQSLCPYTYHVLPIIPSQPLCFSFPFPLLTLCGCLFLFLSRAVPETPDSLCQRYTCFSSHVSVPSFFCLYFTNSFSLGVLASQFLLGHPQDHRLRTQ